jgi:hypothetical protein
MPQTTVNLTKTLGYVGTLLTDNFASVRGAYRPFYNKTGALLPYGCAVQLTSGTTSNVKPLDTKNATIQGIALYNEFDQGFPIADPTQQGYGDDSLVSVLVKGAADIVVYSENATAIDGVVWVRNYTTDTVNKPIGWHFKTGLFSGSVTGITRASSTATATTASAHNYVVGDRVTISGAGQSEYNITATILTVPSSTTFTFTVSGTPTTPATGTILVDPADFTLWSAARFTYASSGAGVSTINIGGY